MTAHLGEVLNEEFLKPLGMSVNALAIGFAGTYDAHRCDRRDVLAEAAEATVRAAAFAGWPAVAANGDALPIGGSDRPTAAQLC